MNDLISRATALEVLEAIMNLTGYQGEKVFCGKLYAQIKDLPTIGAVPVVRCKKCKMWNTEWKHEAGDCYCYKFFQWTDPDFFCASGEVEKS